MLLDHGYDRIGLDGSIDKKNVCLERLRHCFHTWCPWTVGIGPQDHKVCVTVYGKGPQNVRIWDPQLYTISIE